MAQNNNARSEVLHEQLDTAHELPSSEEASRSVRQDEDAQHVSAERDELRERISRMQAEFENARKRMAKEQEQFRSIALTDALKSLLPVMDSLDRAVQSPSTTQDEFRSGVALIRKQLEDVLGKLGVQPVPAEGTAFDPLWHEAVEIAESPDAEDNRVVAELQRGYKLRDRLLRPAMVRVARNPER